MSYVVYAIKGVCTVVLNQYSSQAFRATQHSSSRHRTPALPTFPFPFPTLTLAITFLLIATLCFIIFRLILPRGACALPIHEVNLSLMLPVKPMEDTDITKDIPCLACSWICQLVETDGTGRCRVRIRRWKRNSKDR